VIDRVQELIEGGYDVNHMDKENVSLLHWGAINNRADLVRYEIFKILNIWLMFFKFNLLWPKSCKHRRNHIMS